jgi:predicted unusual protein kinase regulating ubiquinone biosynthesis (AarF/ABC1/UbiB family)
MDLPMYSLVTLQRFLDIEDATITLHEEGLLSKPLPERMRLALEELGPTFVKGPGKPGAERVATGNIGPSFC